MVDPVMLIELGARAFVSLLDENDEYGSDYFQRLSARYKEAQNTRQDLKPSD